MSNLSLRARFLPRERLDLPAFRRIMSDLGRVMWLLKDTRAYEDGIDLMLVLFRTNDEYADELRSRPSAWQNTHFGREIDEYEGNQYELAMKLLELLDKADRWEDFIRMYDDLEKIPFGDRIKAFRAKRLGIVQRKLDRAKAGKSVRHLRHGTQTELTDEELEQRYKRTLRLIEEGDRMRREYRP